MIPGPIIDPVLEEVGDDPEQILSISLLCASIEALRRLSRSSSI